MSDGYELQWDSTIEKDSAEFTLIPDGDYPFKVMSFERGRHNGSDKLPACNKAILTLEVYGPETVTMKHNLFLHSNTEGILCSFFTCIGQRKHGEKLSMNWNKVVGSTGKCKVIVKEFESNKEAGKMLKGNEIKKFYPPEEKPAGFEPGKF